MVKTFHDFSKPINKFIRDMIYGIQATGDADAMGAAISGLREP